jgi:hypothetical protein
MRSRDTGESPDGQRRPRRTREKWARRWGQIERDDLEALVAEIEGDGEKRDAVGSSAAWLDAISRVAFAILRGTRLGTESYVVGVLGGEEDPAQFACVRATDGRVVEVFQAFDEGRIDERGPYAITHRERDYSAFGAARAFVDSVGSARAIEALTERSQAPKGTPRPRPADAVGVADA